MLQFMGFESIGHDIATEQQLPSRALLGALSGKASVCQCRRYGFDTLMGKTPLEKEMSTHSSIVAWKIPWIEETSGLQSIGSQKNWTQLRD